MDIVSILIVIQHSFLCVNILICRSKDLIIQGLEHCLDIHRTMRHLYFRSHILYKYTMWLSCVIHIYFFGRIIMSFCFHSYGAVLYCSFRFSSLDWGKRATIDKLNACFIASFLPNHLQQHKWLEWFDSSRSGQNWLRVFCCYDISCCGCTASLRSNCTSSL